jgi:hypothetical protein
VARQAKALRAAISRARISSSGTGRALFREADFVFAVAARGARFLGGYNFKEASRDKSSLDNAICGLGAPPMKLWPLASSAPKEWPASLPAYAAGGSPEQPARRLPYCVQT